MMKQTPNDSVTPSLDIRRGASSAIDEAQAVAELAAAIRGDDTALVIFYCSTSYDLDRIATSMRREFDGLCVIGCTSAGEISPAGYRDGSLTGVSIGSRSVRAVNARFSVSPFEFSAGVSAADELRTRICAQGTAATPANTFALLLIDGLSMQEELVSSCLHQNLQGVPLIGGSAADDVNFRETLVYHDGEFHRQSAVLTLLQTSLPFHIFRTQHFIPSDIKMVVTGADPGRRIVHEINGEPAGVEFARAVGLAATELTPLIFASHPVMVKLGGEYFVRSIQKVRPDGSLTFFCAIDEGLVLTVARARNIVESLDEAFADVRARIGPPVLTLGFDCILRRLELEQRHYRSIAGEILQRHNVVGFATYGEQFNALHLNQTFTGVALGLMP